LRAAVLAALERGEALGVAVEKVLAEHAAKLMRRRVPQTVRCLII